MACPFASTLGVFASLGGAWTLLVQDRGGRWFTGAALLLVVAGWAAYFVAWRTPAVRIGLEVASVAWLLAAVLRVRWLMRARGLRPPLLDPATRLTRRVWARVGSPWVAAAKVLLLAMLAIEWLGRAEFGALAYGALTALLLALMALRARATAPARARGPLGRAS